MATRAKGYANRICMRAADLGAHDVFLCACTAQNVGVVFVVLMGPLGGGQQHLHCDVGGLQGHAGSTSACAKLSWFVEPAR